MPPKISYDLDSNPHYFLFLDSLKPTQVRYLFKVMNAQQETWRLTRQVALLNFFPESF